MGKILKVLKYNLTSGGGQKFLGAKWIPFLLNAMPAKRKKQWALRILSLSPHYFGKNLVGRPVNEHLEAESNRNLESRRQIFEHILKPYLNKGSVVLDYGCGPGYLARITADHVHKLYGYDISIGALACAGILNNAPNIVYSSKIPDDAVGLDLIYSTAVVYHVTDEELDQILHACFDRLKQGGKVLFHVKLDDPVSRTEEQWRSDRSLAGRLKYRYGLHYFTRSEEALVGLFSKYFMDIRVEVAIPGSDLDGEYILTATKKAGELP